MTVNTFVGGFCIIVGLLIVLKAMKVKPIKPISDGIARRTLTVINYDYEFQTKEDHLRLRLNPEIHAIPGVRVEGIDVEIKSTRYETDFKPMEEAISGDIGGYVYTRLPKSFQKGKYQARIIAHIDNKEEPSESFTMEYVG